MKISVLAVYGGKDEIIAFALPPPNVKAKILPDVGHMAHMEAAAEVDKLIDAFLSSHD